MLWTGSKVTYQTDANYMYFCVMRPCLLSNLSNMEFLRVLFLVLYSLFLSSTTPNASGPSILVPMLVNFSLDVLLQMPWIKCHIPCPPRQSRNLMGDFCSLFLNVMGGIICLLYVCADIIFFLSVSFSITHWYILIFNQSL